MTAEWWIGLMVWLAVLATLLYQFLIDHSWQWIVLFLLTFVSGACLSRAGQRLLHDLHDFVLREPPPRR
jgi:hypothetical protein